MRLVPLRYPLRSITVRWSASLFSAFGIAMTVAVFTGVMSLRRGFEGLYAVTGRDDIGVYLRPSSQSESESMVRYPVDTQIVLARPEVATGAHGEALAASESFLGINLHIH